MGKRVRRMGSVLRKRDAVELLQYHTSKRHGELSLIAVLVVYAAFSAWMLVIGDWGPLDFALMILVGVGSGYWMAAYSRPREERGLVASHGDFSKFKKSRERAEVESARLKFPFGTIILMTAVLLLAISVVGRDSPLLGDSPKFEVFWAALFAPLVNSLLFLWWYRRLPD